MKDLEDTGRDYAKTFLESLDYTVESISRHPINRKADLRVTDGPFIVEVKSRMPDVELAAKVAAADVMEVVPFGMSLGKDNSMSGDFKTANKQLASTRAATDQFGCLLILLSDTMAKQDENEVVIATLYGKRLAWLEDGIGGIETAEVFFAERNDFHRFTEIDCAIWLRGNEAQLLCNPFSPRIEAVRSNSLYAKFRGGILDKLPDDAYVVDSNMDRKDVPAVCAYLSKKYGRKFLNLSDLAMSGAIVPIPIKS
jgi:hypothetical protein